MPKEFVVLFLDGVSDQGIEVLRNLPEFETRIGKSLSEDELIQALSDVDALVVRSGTKVTRKALQSAPKLKVVGRAGVGVDNVEVPAATERGIVVMNTPGGNTISTAEHAFSLMLSTARMIPQAHGSMKAGKWDRKTFQGVELNQKTLGILGMGRIGSEVARRAKAFNMRVLAYDPYLSEAKAKSLEVELFDKYEDMLPHCDFITMHMPLTKETKGMLNKNTLPLCKKGVRLINCARGGLIVEADLLEALRSGQVAGAALDVYEQEPPPADFVLRECDQIVMTPHLGASTEEAQVNVGVEVAEAIRDMLREGSVRNAVNAPSVDGKTLAALRPYITLGSKLGKIIQQISPNRNDLLTVSYFGKIRDQDTSTISRSILTGFLQQAGDSGVNDINALHYADNLGLKFQELKCSEQRDHSELIEVKVKSSNGSEYQIGATYFGSSPRIVTLHGRDLDAQLDGVLMVFENKDRPGIVGWIGNILAKHNINIASMSLSRSKPGAGALSLLNLDSMPDESLSKEILECGDITNLNFIQL